MTLPCKHVLQTKKMFSLLVQINDLLPPKECWCTPFFPCLQKIVITFPEIIFFLPFLKIVF